MISFKAPRTSLMTSQHWFNYLSQCSSRSMVLHDVSIVVQSLMNSEHAELCFKITKDIFTFWIVSSIWLHTSGLNKLLNNKQCLLAVWHSQYHACWCSGDFRSLGINRHGIDPQKQEYYAPASAELITNLCFHKVPSNHSWCVFMWSWSWSHFVPRGTMSKALDAVKRHTVPDTDPPYMQIDL